MHEFFHGWRRMLGCAILVVALGLANLWMESMFVEHTFAVVIGNRTHVISASMGEVTYLSLNEVIRYRFWSVRRAEPDGFRYVYTKPLEILQLDPREGLSVLYSHLTLPLTLVAAYLIIWKPRKQSCVL